MKSTVLYIETKEVLVELAYAIQELTLDEYMRKIPLLSNASIGEHTRHIIEMFQQLSVGYVNGVINYDSRKRDIRLQSNIDFALESIAIIVSELCKPDKILKINSLYNNNEECIESNYERELMYNIEHCIHHQAILKIAFLYLGKSNTGEYFGVAKSTIAYRSER